MSLKNVREIEKNKVEVVVLIAKSDFEAATADAFRKNVRKITVPGFRKGKAPRGIIEKFYGKGVFYEDALNALLPDAMESAVKETGYTPVETPSIDKADFDAPDGVEVTAVFTRRPDVTLGEYKGYKVTKYVVSVTDADVDAELENVRKRYARTVSVDNRPVANGDIVTIDYEGSVDGVPFDGGKDEGHKLTIGSNQFIPGFEDQLVGHSAGEEFDIKVTFPADYHAENLAGKEAVFHINLHTIEYEELPQLDDEFAKDASNFDTLDAYKADLKAKIEKRNEDEADMRVGESLAAQLCDAVEADIPDVMYEKETDLLVREYDMNLRQQGLSLEMLLQYTNMKMEDIRARNAATAVANVKKQLALSEIVKAENIVPDDEAVEARYAELAAQFDAKIDEVKARIDVEDVKDEIAALRAFEVVKNAAEITVKNVTREELNDILNPKDDEAEKPKTKKTAAKKADGETPKKKAAPKTKAAAAKEEEKEKAEEKAEEPAETAAPAKKPTAKKTAKKADADASAAAETEPGKEAEKADN